jgi:tetratricopeptide (TPR) repeat protein
MHEQFLLVTSHGCMADPASLFAQAAAALQQRNWRRADTLTSQLLPLAPDRAEVHYFAGIAALETQRLAQALQHFRRATQLDPIQPEFAALLAKALSTARLSQEARAAADRALALSPRNPMTLTVLGSVYAQNQAHAQAVSAFRSAVALAPSQALPHFNLATALLAMGGVNEAEREIEACLALEPTFWRAHLTLAHLRRQTLADHHVARLQSLLLQGRGDNTAQVCLNLALAKEYEDLGDYPTAFEHLLLGKAASRKGVDYSHQQDAALFSALERTFPKPQAPQPGNPSAEPIFVFGMPRTGTTLVERILSSHPDVESAGELQNFGVSLMQAWGNRAPLWLDPDTAAHAHTLDWCKVGTDYISSTRPATGQTAHFVDKLPHNFLYAGFIARALPNARMICLRRNPMDACLSSFRQLFAEKLPYYNYSFDLLDTGRYYILFDHLMAHWQRVFPGRILEISYETIVEEQESATRQLLRHCGLPWNDACLHFEQNEAPVATASSLQVREPIYRSAAGRWKKYEPQLATLRRLLADADIDVDG